MKNSLPKYILFTSLLLAAINTKAQYVLKQADDQYNQFNYYKAADLYAQAYKKKPTLHAAEHLAESYRLMNDYKNEESWYAATLAMPGSKPDNVLKYAKALQKNSKYSEAKVQYANYAKLNTQVDAVQLNQWLASCDSAIYWMQNPSQLLITNERALNSETSDWGAAVYNGEVIFASDRIDKALAPKPGGKPFLKFDGNKVPDKTIYGWTGNGYLKLYQFDKSKTTSDSVGLFPITAETDYHTGPAVFSPGGNEMYFTITRIPKKIIKDKNGEATIRLEIYSSKRDAAGSTWSKPVAFKYNNIDKWSVGDPFISLDGKYLYFVSDMPGGKGGTDIYYCLKDANDNWATPVNLAAVNTLGNERTPVLDSLSNLYYASDGGIGMGGLDIFKAVRNGNSFGKSQNMGYPVNSPQDDFAYLTTGPTTGYLSSNRVGGAGSDDIYSFAAKPVIAFKLEGIVYDKTTHVALNNSIVTLSKIQGTPLKVQTDATGAFKFNLEEKSDYNVLGEKTNYRSDNQNVTTNGLTTSTVIKQDLYLERIEINKPIVLKNINYDFDKSVIRADAKVELNKLIKVLQDNPTIWIELSSHTDSRGSNAYNMALSQRRASSAVRYIIETGKIDRNRITAQGYGETQLLNRCADGVKCTEAEHSVNRRTEFKIVKQ